MRLSGSLSILFTFLFGSSLTYAQCTVPQGFSSSVERARIVLTPPVQGLSAQITQGIADWNDAPCVNHFLNPFPFTQFHMGSSGTPVIDVRFLDMNGGDKIAQMTILTNSQDATIELFTRTTVNGVELPINWSAPGALRDAIAHELGHYLGLNDSPCFGHIMSSALLSNVGGQAVIAPTREVKMSECNFADETNQTEWEEEEEACQLDPTCDPNAPCGPFCCPIVIDFDGDDFTFSGGPVTFDIDNNGVAEHLTWIDGNRGDVFLVMDRNGNGVVDDGSELFGNGTPLSNGFVAPHGYMALQDLDAPSNGGNGDGFLSASDHLFTKLQLWHDGNQNAVSESWELKGMPEGGLIWIDLRYSSFSRIDGHGNNLKFLSPALVRRGNRFVRTWAGDVFFKKIER